MKNLYIIWISCAILCLACQGQRTAEQNQERQIGKDLFQHHYITQDLPGDTDWGYGCPAMADFDNDGDLDYAFSGAEGLYWFENTGNFDWTMHKVGVMPIKQLGATSYDVDKDGWEDIIIGRYWYRNNQNPREEAFIRYQYDEKVETNIHDIVMADVDGNDAADVIIIGENEGLFWYHIPTDPNRDIAWPKTEITLDVLAGRDRIHGGFYPNGVDDLDGDGDKDLVLPDRWLENSNNGTTWEKHPLPFGKRGPYGLSSRSWIVDIDRDGDNDIVMTDCDQQCSRIAWLENHGNNPPVFTSHFLPMTATGIRGSFHSLYVGDFDQDGDYDIFTCDQEDDSIFPEGAFPRWYIWENISTDSHIEFEEKVIFDSKLGGHDALIGDIDGDGDLDILSKVWNLWPDNPNQGREHADCLENKLID
jgi:hypothetical protein